MLLRAPAKLNLFLQLPFRRADGFHEIQSVFQTISLYDWLWLSPPPASALRLKVAFPRLRLSFSPSSKRLTAGLEDDLKKNNSLFKAYAALESVWRKKTGLRPLTEEQRRRRASSKAVLAVELIKNVPIGAGLGGGSSDAAAFLVGINSLWRLGLSRSKLQTVAAAVGSDVPFFLTGGLALAEGRGEKIEPLPLAWNPPALVVSPRQVITTASAYRENATLGEVRSFSTLKALLRGLASASLLKQERALRSLFSHYAYNAFEKKTLPRFKALAIIKKKMRSSTALALLTGSGASLFGVFHDSIEATKCYLHLAKTQAKKAAPPRLQLTRFVPFGVSIERRGG